MSGPEDVITTSERALDLGAMRLRVLEGGDQRLREVLLDLVAVAEAQQARLDLLEPGLRGVLYQPEEPDIEASTLTLFGIPVRLCPDVTATMVRDAVGALKPGLSRNDVVACLQRDGLVVRVDQ